MEDKHIEHIAFALFCKERMMSDYDTWWIKEEDMEMLKDVWKSVIKSKNAKHFGDCTNDPCPCERCYVNTFFSEAKLILKYSG